MNSQRNILVAFLLNLVFSVFEFLGGLFTGSVAIASDALHDLGDALSIGVSYFLERKSKTKPDSTHTYGYGRYSVLGGFITTVILAVGSVLVIIHAVQRLLHPTGIHYNGMILFAVVGVIVNSLAAFFTRDGKSLNQKAVNLHMLEDVLGWFVVLVGAVVIKFTRWTLIDPLLSIGVAVFILIHAFENLKTVLDLFLEKTPQGICREELKAELRQIPGVLDIHHIHLWSIDGLNHSATMHVRTEEDPHIIKEAIREKLAHYGIGHATLELETADEVCHGEKCRTAPAQQHCYHGHHHHHH